MQDPDNYDEETEASANNPDQKTELNCGIVMSKCWGELMGIFLYLIMVCILITGLISQLNDGKPMTCLLEFGIAVFIDCIKQIPCQFIIWWVVIRRFGKLEQLNFEHWDDEVILAGGAELSLF
jgi:hypothetical protein